MQFLLNSPPETACVVKSDEPNPKLYFAFLPTFTPEMAPKQQGIVFIGSTFAIGMLTHPPSFEALHVVEESLKASLKPDDLTSLKIQTKDKVSAKKPGDKKAQNFDKVLFFSLTVKSGVNPDVLSTLLVDKLKFKLVD